MPCFLATGRAFSDTIVVNYRVRAIMHITPIPLSLSNVEIDKSQSYLRLVRANATCRINFHRLSFYDISYYSPVIVPKLPIYL